MSKINIKFNSKAFEKELNKKINKIIESKQKEIIIKQNKEKKSMNVLSENAETMLEIFLNKYNGSGDYSISGNVDEFPKYMKFSIKNTMETLKLYDYISFYDNFIDGGWVAMLTPEATKYFENKGRRIELFDELADNEKDLLAEIISAETEGKNITQLLANKIEYDKNDIVRGIIGALRKNGLINVSWADNTVYNASLTNSGRTYFEREKKNSEKMKMLSQNSYNINTLNANNSSFVLGNAIDTNLNTNNPINQIEQEIENRCVSDEEKKELKEILNEAKEIIENIEESKHVEKRKNFFQKLISHFDEHGWFYAEIVSLLGQTVIKLLGGE